MQIPQITGKLKASFAAFVLIISPWIMQVGAQLGGITSLDVIPEIARMAFLATLQTMYYTLFTTLTAWLGIASIAPSDNTLLTRITESKTLNKNDVIDAANAAGQK